MAEIDLLGEFSPDGSYPDYRAVLRVLLGLIDPDLPEGTLFTEWWDEEEGRVLVRITPRQAFRYTMEFALDGARVDVRGIVDGLNGFLLILGESGRFELSEDSDRRVSYDPMQEM